MKKRLLLCFCFLLVGFGLMSAQEENNTDYRTINGTFNNLNNPDWGSAGINLLRVTEMSYEDGFASPGGQENRPNPRHVSNLLFSQTESIPERLQLSDYIWVFGQFLDHDLGLTPDGNEPAFIEVPRGDNWFDPNREGQAIIPMMRNVLILLRGRTFPIPGNTLILLQLLSMDQQCMDQMIIWLVG